MLRGAGKGAVAAAISILLLCAVAAAASAGTIYVTKIGNDTTGTGELWNPYLTVQKAVDETAPGDLIRIGTGEYVEDLSIATANLDIGPWDTAVVTIKGVAVLDDTLWPLADPNIDIQASGVAIHDVTIESPDVPTASYSSGIVLTGENIELYNNTFIQHGAGTGYGVVIQTYHESAIPGSDIDGLHIHDNVFQGTPGGNYVPLYVNYTATAAGAVTFEDNNCSGNIFYVVTERSNTIFRNNTIVRDTLGGSTGIRIQDIGGAANAIQDVVVDGNTVENFAAGLRTGVADTLTNIAVTGNTFTANTLQVRDDSGDLDMDAILAGNTLDKAVVVDHPGASLLHTIWTSIQDGIDAAAAGDTVLVGDGTYTEDLTIDKGLTLEAFGLGARIDGSHTISVSNVTVVGFAFGVIGTGILIDASGGALDTVSIADNTFDMAVSPTVGIYVGGGSPTGAVTNVYIANNVFDGPADKVANPFKIGGGYGSPVSCAVENLTFLGNTVNRCSTPINLQDANLTGIHISFNTYLNTDGAVYVWGEGSPTGVLSDFKFILNSVDATNTYGLAFFGFEAGAPLFGLVDTVFTDANFGTGNSANGNEFVGIPGGYGLGGVTILATLTTYVFDATDNWWGTANGPEHAGNTYNVAAQGPGVSDHVDYVQWLVGPGGPRFAAVTKNSVPTFYASIQAALDVAEDGDTITCAAGTFTEDIALNVPNVELAGAGATTILQGVARRVYTDWPNATANIDVRGAGCVLHDFTARNPVWVNDYYSSGMIVGAQNVEVHHVTFDGPTSDDTNDISQCFQTWHTVDISGLNLHDCVFTTSGAQLLGYEGIYINGGGSGTVTIADNQLGENLFRGISTVRENVTISGNTIVTIADPANAWAGINIDANNVTVTGNDVSGTSGFGVGIDLGQDGVAIQDVVVNDNTIGPGNNTGIRVRGDVVGTGIDARHNDIAGNINWGIDASTTTGLDVNAIECWWGDVNGPSGQGTGAGDAVSVNVDFAPWLNGPGGTPVDRPEVTALDVVQSVSKADWYDTEGDWAGGFWMTLDPDQEYHYLDVRDLATTQPIRDGYHEFFLDQASLPAGFFGYWAGKGVNGTDNAGGWELQMWEIINGRDPMFYLRTGTGDPMLVDGLQKLIAQPDDFLRVNGGYPPGEYTFTGTVTEVNGIESAPFDVVMTFYRAPDVTFDGFAADPDFVVGGAFGEFDVTVDNTADGADYAHALYELRIDGPIGETLTSDMFRLQKEGSWSDVALSTDGDDLVAVIPETGLAMDPAYVETDTFRLKAQLGAPVGDYSLVVTVIYFYVDPIPPIWLLRVADQPFTVGGQGAAMTQDVGTGWTMISVPIVGDDAVPETVFADVVASGQPLVIYEWVAGGSYHTPTEIDPGKGYWLYLFSPVTVSLAGDLPSADHAVALGLDGWHQISTPKWPVGWKDVRFTDGVDAYTFDEAVANGWILPYVYWYNTDDGQYYAADIVDGAAGPWTGYWLYTLVPNLTMTLPMDQPYIPVGPTSALRAMARDATVRPPAPPRLPMDAKTLGIEFGNSPNPIRDVRTTTFYVKGAIAELVEAIRVQIFDQSGRVVYERTEEGAQLDWHTDNDYGEYLANGVYLYKLWARIQGQWVVSEVRKLAILR